MMTPLQSYNNNDCLEMPVGTSAKQQEVNGNCQGCKGMVRNPFQMLHTTALDREAASAGTLVSLDLWVSKSHTPSQCRRTLQQGA